MAQILIVEGDAMTRANFRNFLGGDHELIMASSKGEAKRLLELNGNLDLIIVELVLPDGNGLEFLQLIRARRADVLVIVITESPEAETMEQALNFNVCAYVAKPFLDSQIREQVVKALRELDSPSDEEEEYSEWGSPSDLDEDAPGSRLGTPVEQNMARSLHPSGDLAQVMESFNKEFRPRQVGDQTYRPGDDLFRSRALKKR